MKDMSKRYDYDPRHYSFERRSGLHRSQFADKKMTADAWVFIACIILLGIALVSVNVL